MLAGLSVDYYARLERGRVAGASESVLEAVARALQLDDAERQHLFDLARNGGATTSRRQRRPKPVAAPPPAVTSILTALTIPAYVRTSRMDIVAANGPCQALFGGALDADRLPVNLARYMFLDPHSRGVYLDWESVADDLVGSLRVQAGRDPRDKAMSDLIGELSTRSDEFVDPVGPAERAVAPDEPKTAPQPRRRRHRVDRERPGAAGRRAGPDRLHRRRRLPGRRPAAAPRQLDRHPNRRSRPRRESRLSGAPCPPAAIRHHRPRLTPREEEVPCPTSPP